MSTGRQPKRPRQQNGSRQSRDATVGKLLTIHDISIEKLKSSLVIFLFVPKILNDKIEAAATAWKAKNVPGKGHPDGCSCTTARLKAFVEGISEGLTNSLLQCPAEAKTALERIVQVINNGGAESVVSDITLRTTATRPADQSPYEVSLVASAEGQMFRSSLQAITQPDSPGENTRDRPEKCWEFRPYRPRRGALVREL